MRVQVNGIRLFFEIEGTKLRLTDDSFVEVPTLLLLHGAGIYRSGWGDSQVVVLNKRLVIVNPAAANVDNNQIRLEPLGAGRFKYMPTTGGGSVGETVYFDETPGKPMRMFVGDDWSTRIEK